MNGLTKWHLDTFFGIEFYCWKILWMRVKFNPLQRKGGTSQCTVSDPMGLDAISVNALCMPCNDGSRLC